MGREKFGARGLVAMVVFSLIFFMIFQVGCQTTQSTDRGQEARSPSRKGLLYSEQIRLVWPVRGRVTSTFGRRWSRSHEGLDISAPRGTPIRAAYGGRVLHAGWRGGYGRTVVLSHGAVKSLYAHCAELLVSRGDMVEQGEVIARVGKSGRSTGHHLHFEIRSPRWTALNPMDYLPLRF